MVSIETYLETHKSLNVDAGGQEEIIDKDEHINTDTQT